MNLPKVNQAFTLIEVLITLGVIALLATIAIANVIKSREKAQLTSIVTNLKNIENAKEQWGLEAKKGVGDIPAVSEIQPYLKAGAMPTPSSGESYQINGIGNPATAILPATTKLGTYPAGGTVTVP